MPQVYRGDVFVSPSLAEAFSIPCAEAMACGLPVITTDFGGQTDYVTQENGFILKTTPFEVLHDVMYEGIQWGMPNLLELRAVMRYCYEHKDIVKAKGAASRIHIESYTWHETAKKLLNAIQEE